MSAAFAALEKRAGAAVVSHLANAWAVIAGAPAFPGVFTRQPIVEIGAQGRDITLLVNTAALPADTERDTHIDVYADEALTELLGSYSLRLATEHLSTGNTMLELEVDRP